METADRYIRSSRAPHAQWIIEEATKAPVYHSQAAANTSYLQTCALSQWNCRGANGQSHDFSFSAMRKLQIREAKSKMTQQVEWYSSSPLRKKWGLLDMWCPFTRIRMCLWNGWRGKHENTQHCDSYLMQETFGCHCNLGDGVGEGQESHWFWSTHDQVCTEDQCAHFALDVVKFIKHRMDSIKHRMNCKACTLTGEKRHQAGNN